MRVAVLGAGYAGLTLARKLESKLPDDADLVVVDEDGTHLVQHELHRVVRRPSLADEITLDLDDVLDEATVREARVTDTDPEAGVATLDGSETLDYDYAAVCLGATTNFYDLPGVETHATPLKRLEHAETIRADFLDVLDAATPEDPRRVVVGGAGLSGIQVAGELAALAREEHEREERAAAEAGDSESASDDDPIELTLDDEENSDADREGDDAGREGDDAVSDAAEGTMSIPGEAVELLLLEMKPNVAPGFPENFQQAVRNALEDRNVRVRTDAAVASADADAIELDSGESIDHDQFVWTGGIRGPAALDDERPPVRNTLRLGDGTFVLGDAGKVVDTDGEAVPASAQAAVRQARVVAKNVEKLVDHERSGAGGFEPRLDGYRFDSPGWLVSVGDGAVAQIGPTVLTGYAAKALKTSVGAGYLSSVGAVENAVDLVREELGWPDGDDEELDDTGEEAGDGKRTDEGAAGAGPTDEDPTDEDPTDEDDTQAP